MQVTADLDNIARVAIFLYNFGHDTNGNAIAKHTVYTYAKPDQDLFQPTASPYETRTRQQIGAGSNRDDWAPSALRLAGLPSWLTLTRTEGSRSEGQMILIYDLWPEPKFKPGQLVEYTNGYGVYLGIHKIVSHEYRTRRPCYNIIPTDTPWFAVGEESFKAVDIDNPASTYVTYGREFKTHAFPDDASANAFMESYAGWGLIGIDYDDGIERLRHVAKMSDNGKPVK